MLSTKWEVHNVLQCCQRRTKPQLTHTENFMKFGHVVISRPLQCNVRLLSWHVVCNMRVLWPNGLTDQDETWHSGRPWPKWHCIRWGQAPPTQRGAAALPIFLAHVYCGQTAAWIRTPRGMQIGLYALLGEAIFSACHTNPNPTHWSLAFVMGANRRA